ncbi:hypothetical protein CMV_012206 [Castanea mollissima]|uniref:Uncharacterized protein n=1 Tax=Castanea mollissima TaxID=60419 RepID=A0A8J4R1U4_9ROSI|nr:hypothetical protein CMV_012206 [Castanea mollissima]
MGKILARDGELTDNERWIKLIGDIASCISIKRLKEILESSPHEAVVEPILLNLSVRLHNLQVRSSTLWHVY